MPKLSKNFPKNFQKSFKKGKATASRLVLLTTMSTEIPGTQKDERLS